MERLKKSTTEDLKVKVYRFESESLWKSEAVNILPAADNANDGWNRAVFSL